MAPINKKTDRARANHTLPFLSIKPFFVTRHRSQPQKPAKNNPYADFLHNWTPSINSASLASLVTNLCSSTLVLVGMIFILSSTLVLQYLCTIVQLYYSTFVLQYTSTIVGLYYSTFVLVRMIIILREYISTTPPYTTLAGSNTTLASSNFFYYTKLASSNFYKYKASDSSFHLF